MKCKKRGCQEPIAYVIQQRGADTLSPTFDHAAYCTAHGLDIIAGMINATLPTLTEILLKSDTGRVVIKKVPNVQDSHS